jgi:hypothetical protein
MKDRKESNIKKSKNMAGITIYLSILTQNQKTENG